MIAGVWIGILTALVDGLLLWAGVRWAAVRREKASVIMYSVLAARYLLVVLVLAAVLLAGNGINAAGVVIPLIVQKVVLAISSLLPQRKEK